MFSLIRLRLGGKKEGQEEEKQDTLLTEKSEDRIKTSWDSSAFHTVGTQ